MQVHRLQPFAPTSAVDAVIVEIEARDLLLVRWRIAGDVRIPDAPLDPHRLFEHTCCELFVAPSPGEAYDEWNVSPTRQVTRFAFSDYRARVSVDTPALDVTLHTSPRELVVEAGFPLPPTDARLSPTAVVEDPTGRLSYWALHHPCARPDFHHRGGFVVTMPR